MTFHSPKDLNGYIIKLPQHLIFHEQVIRDAVARLCDFFEIFVLIELFEAGMQWFHQIFFDVIGSGVRGIGWRLNGYFTQHFMAL